VNDDRGAIAREQTRNPEGDFPARAGETARQLIRRAGHANRKRSIAEEKIRIAMEGIRAEVSLADLCRREC
jgi:hypothetical protein